jgi:hypothetical protein
MIKEPQVIKPKPDRTIINIDAQKQLAKLLATEDIQVTVGNFKTAYFDVKNRVLGLPAWNTDTKEVSDLLVGHEVGHALFTPEDGITKFKERYPKLPFDIANIVEDIRIEKMIQFKYPGLIKSFNDGYSYFKENDLFEIKDKDVNALGFIDRINLKGKLRDLIDVQFSDEETILFDKVNRCKTYDDVLDVIQELADFIEQEEEKNPKEKAKQPSDDGEDNPMSNNSEAGDDDLESEEDDGDSSSKSSEDKNSSPDTNTSQGGNSGGQLHDKEEETSEAFKSETQDSLDKHLEDLGEMASNETILNQFPEKNVGNLIYSLDEVRAARKACIHYDAIMNDPKVNESWASFKNSTKKNVMILCKEFERRKAAHSYSRSTQARTGTINVNKLHSYKYDDQIFKSVTNLADAKNHGMNIFIDNSGSMATCIGDVFKQAIQLVVFCKTVDIPFSVYSFTSKSGRATLENGKYIRKYDNKREFFRNNFQYGQNLDVFTTEVVELMNSSLNKSNHEKALKELYIQSGAIYSNGKGDKPYIEIDQPYAGKTYKTNLYLEHNCMSSELEEMGGTPLIETLIMSHAIIKNFRKKNNVEKMITVFLTDGEGQTPSSHLTEPKTEDEEPQGQFHGNSSDPWGNYRYIKIGKHTVDISRQNPNAYSDVVEIIKKETGSKMIGFYLTSSAANGRAHSFGSLSHIKNLRKWEYIDKCKNEAKKLKSNCYALENGYNFDTYFVIDNLRSLKINDDEEFQVPDTVDTEDLNKAANRSKLATSFKKFNTTKRQSRIFLNKFIDTVI